MPPSILPPALRRFFLALLLFLPLLCAANPPQLIEARKIWDGAPHCAFTDLARWQEAWWCVFREAQGHVGGDGKIRVLTSRDGVAWESAALLAEDGIDLRDPKLSTTPDGRLMLTLGGSLYRGDTKLLGRQPRVAFSKDGRTWTAPQKVLTEGDWLWRVTWHGGVAYGTSYRTPAPDANAEDWGLTMYRSHDGLAWEKVSSLAVNDHPNETTLRFRPNGECLALVRREAGDKQAWFGRAQPPYAQWSWQPVGRFIGGPNFIFTADGTMVAAGRDLSSGRAQTALGVLTDTAWEPTLVLPSGGDTSYAGLVEYDGALWASYYSSHEGKSAIYLARIRWP